MKVTIEKGETKLTYEDERSIPGVRDEDIVQLCHLFAGLYHGWIPTPEDKGLPNTNLLLEECEQLLMEISKTRHSLRGHPIFGRIREVLDAPA
jgi:hypothetical protein